MGFFSSWTEKAKNVLTSDVGDLLKGTTTAAKEVAAKAVEAAKAASVEALKKELKQQKKLKTKKLATDVCLGSGGFWVEFWGGGRFVFCR